MKIEELKALGVSDAAVSFCRGTSSTLVLNFGLGTQVVPEELATLSALETNGGEVVWAAEDSYKRVLSLNYAADYYSGTLTLTDRVERLNQCVYASINKLTGLPDFAVTRSAVVAAQNGNPATFTPPFSVAKFTCACVLMRDRKPARNWPPWKKRQSEQRAALI